MEKHLSRAEALLFAGVGALFVLAVFLPSFAQDQAYHGFADARTFAGVPRALDVLSNLGFLVLGLLGLALSRAGRLAFFSPALKNSATVFFLGFVATALGSAYYHAAPNDFGLAVDRLGMVVAFAGLLGMAAAQRISERAGATLLALSLVAGPASVACWLSSGSVTPYAVLQFGGILLALACMLAPARGIGPQWWILLATYALAKLTETFDVEIFALTGELVSGHTLKHLLAALPAWAVIAPLRVPAVARDGQKPENAHIS